MTPVSDHTPIIDPSHDMQSRGANALDAIFSPKVVAVVGATEKEGSVGRTVLWNIIRNPFGGTVYPINPKRPQVLGIRAYPSVKNVPEPVDLAVICTAAKVVPDAVKDCVDAGVKGIIIISAGFKEMGPSGIAAETQIMELVRGTGIRIIGPNCLGVMSPLSGINATFAADMARPGKVAFISQSGALCTAILDWSIQEQVGFSAFVSIGSMLDVDWGDLISYFGADPRTNAIVIYMESVGDAQSFLSAAREIALTKPIIIIKAGRTEAAAKAAASHTGSLTGSDAVLDAAFKRVGVMRVDHISDLFAMADTLAKQPLPKGNNLTVLTNAGGPGVLAADELVLGGGKLTEISKEAFDAFNSILPPHWSRNNPVDVLGDATPELYAKTLEIAAKDKNADAMLVILTPQEMTNPTQTAEALVPYARSLGKPVFASWMGGPRVRGATEILQRAGIPNFDHPDNACRAFNHLWRYSSNLNAIYETAQLSDEAGYAEQYQAVGEMIERVKQEGRTLLNEFESKKLLEAYGIPVVKTEIAHSPDEAAKLASAIGFPVVLKLYSNTITHKTDVGGVKLNINSAAEAMDAYQSIKTSVSEKAGAQHFQGVTVQQMVDRSSSYEIILGSSVDPQFGPVLLFGAGGIMVEVVKDRSLGLPPLTPTLARRMMEETKIYKALKGVRGRKPVDLDELEKILVHFSYLVSQQQWIKELDINPLLASSERIIALDARVLLHDLNTPKEKLSRPAVRPYPVEYVERITLKDGQQALIRPIRPEDEKSVINFHKGLSEQTVRNRYHQDLSLEERISHSRLVRICFADYSKELPLVAFKANGQRSGDAPAEILGICRYRRWATDSRAAEFALLVSDAYQGKGLGKKLLASIIAAAKKEGFERIASTILSSNAAGIALCKSMGFAISDTQSADHKRAELTLT